MSKNRGFTLLEVVVVISIMSIIVTTAVPNFNGYFDKLKLNRTVNRLVANIYWTREQAIKTGQKWGIIFDSDTRKYLIIKKEEPETVIKEINLTEGVEIKLTKTTLPDYQEDKKAVFFKKLGNLAHENGQVVLRKAAVRGKKVVFSSNAGEINVRQEEK
jgi:type IV fimbrial biogenesis protein FimT